MLERRARLRYRLNPPLPGRAFIDGIGQFDAQLLDVSTEGARMTLALNPADDPARFAAAGEKGVTAVFARPDGVPWKLVLLHTRLTPSNAAGSAAACDVAGRFVDVPSFTAADLDQLVAAGLAVRT